jgi:hypothetical protein
MPDLQRGDSPMPLRNDHPNMRPVGDPATDTCVERQLRIPLPGHGKKEAGSLCAFQLAMARRRQGHSCRTAARPGGGVQTCS